MGVDGVVADDPGDRAGIEHVGGPIEPAKGCRPSHQRAPGERQPEKNLRPIGDPLHERIDRDHRKRGDAGRDRERIELHQHGKPDQRLHAQESRGGGHAYLPGRDRPRARALDQSVEVAIDDIVPGAAGPAHGKGADEEQHGVPGVDRFAGMPPARQQQQPGPDRPVEAGKPQIRARPRRRAVVDPVSG